MWAALWVALASGCDDAPRDGGTDAGLDAGPGRAPGYTDCGELLCSPGRHCDETQTCTYGCVSDDECGDREGCTPNQNGIGVCASLTQPSCGNGFCDLGEDEPSCPADCPPGYCDPSAQGRVLCGDSECAAETYCFDPAAADCRVGCVSSANCACGTLCVIGPSDTVGDCLAPGDIVDGCGNEVCDDDETVENCPRDCQNFAALCYDACGWYSDSECFQQPFEAERCYIGCDAADDQARETFVNCASTAAAFCDQACLDVVAQPSDAGPIGF